MRIVVTTLLPLIALVACAATFSQVVTDRALRVVPGERPFGDPRIQVLESYPPQFEIVLSRDMPTPGYTFRIDSLEVDEQRGRIVAKVTEVTPQGMVAQVITKTELRLHVGSLRARRYVVEIWTRRGADAEHALVQAMVLVATRSVGRPG